MNNIDNSLSPPEMLRLNRQKTEIQKVIQGLASSTTTNTHPTQSTSMVLDPTSTAPASTLYSCKRPQQPTHGVSPSTSGNPNELQKKQVNSALAHSLHTMVQGLFKKRDLKHLSKSFSYRLSSGDNQQSSSVGCSPPLQGAVLQQLLKMTSHKNLSSGLSLN